MVLGNFLSIYTSPPNPGGIIVVIHISKSRFFKQQIKEEE